MHHVLHLRCLYCTERSRPLLDEVGRGCRARYASPRAVHRRHLTPTEETMARSHLCLIFLDTIETMRILVVEDDVKMAGLIRRGLVEAGLAADIASTGDDALWMGAATEYD